MNYSIKKAFPFAILFFLLDSCGNNDAPVEFKGTGNKTTATCVIKSKSLSSYIKLPGEFFPFQEVSLLPKVNGFVKEVNVDRGTRVKKGDVLLIMEAPELQQQLAEAQAKLAEAEAMINTAKAKFDRLALTSKTPGSVSPFDLESAENEFKSASAKVKAQEANVAAYQSMNDYLNLKAPFDGVITQRNVHPGAFVGPNSRNNEAMLVLKEENKLRLTVFVPEIYSDRLNTTNEILFSINSVPGKIFKSKISRMSGSINTQTRSEAVEIDVTNEPEIKPGMYAEVKLPVKSVELNSFVVPTEAIVTSTERKYVIQVTKDKLTRFIDIKEGISNSDSTEVFGELKDNYVILLKPSAEMTEKQQVK